LPGMKLRIYLALLFYLLLRGTAQAQPPPPVDPDTGWLATYWNNTILAGEPVLQRRESAIDHNWGFGSPHPAVEPDRFSARWTNTLPFPPGGYRFVVTVDDGARLWVDGRLIINEWQVQSERTFTAEIYLAGGVPIRLEHFENTGVALIRLTWQRITVFSERWHAEYYNNRTLSGEPALIRDDAAIDFDWGADSPAPGIINSDAFSVRWQRRIDLPAGQYRFTVTADDGARLWLNGRLLIDEWRPQPATTFERETSLPGGPVTMRMEYFENGGAAVARLDWTRVHPLPATAPGDVVDVTMTGFVPGGPPEEWYQEAEGFQGVLLWTLNNSDVDRRYNWARWFPELEPGRYEVSVFIPERFATTGQAHYWVSHAEGRTARTVDQSAHQAQWVSLGTFTFDGTRSDFVGLADVTFEPDATTMVVFDAVRWMPVAAVAGE
jgi:hypothetical protein